MVTVLREQVLALYAQSSRPPSVVRVSARDVAVEVQWPAAPATATLVPATVTAPRSPSPASAARGEPAAAEEGAATVALRAATVGTFYRAPEPEAKPFVSEGDTVRVGQQVGIIEAMKLMIPVEADRAGRVVECCVDNGTPVEHGQPLMMLESVT